MKQKIIFTGEGIQLRTAPPSSHYHQLDSTNETDETAVAKKATHPHENILSDAELIFLIRQQNEAAYAELAQRYAPLIYSLSASPHAKNIREELISFLQESLYLAALRYDPDRGVPATGYIVHSLRFASWNFCKKAQRQQQREFIYDPHIPVIPLLTEVNENPAERVCHQEDIRRLQQLLPTLTPKQQQVVRGIYFREVSRQHLAAEMNCTPQAVSDLHHRALRNLREQWPIH